MTIAIPGSRSAPLPIVDPATMTATALLLIPWHMGHAP